MGTIIMHAFVRACVCVCVCHKLATGPIIVEHVDILRVLNFNFYARRNFFVFVIDFGKIKGSQNGSVFNTCAGCIIMIFFLKVFFFK